MSKKGGFFDLDKKRKRVKELTEIMNEPNFWQDQARAKKISKEFSSLKEEINNWETLERKIQSLLEISQLDAKERKVNLREEIEKELKRLEKQWERFEIPLLLKGKYDHSNVFLSIFAGAGGTDAQDWAEMLERMYLRYAQRKNFSVNLISRSKGAEAGIKKVNLEIKGPFAYGFLKSEDGVHRLVRISPFDAEKMRHTSFALVQVLPELEEIDEEKIKIEEKDLRIDTFLSSGPGGQGVQTTYSGVRIVHLPTKITVTCQTTRSQKQNKEIAFRILRTKLYHYFQAKQEEEKAKIKGEFKEAAWGNQIRSYILHPYKLVKDHRTGHESEEVEKVLDGEIDDFILAYLRKINETSKRGL